MYVGRYEGGGTLGLGGTFVAGGGGVGRYEGGGGVVFLGGR